MKSIVLPPPDRGVDGSLENETNTARNKRRMTVLRLVEFIKTIPKYIRGKKQKQTNTEMFVSRFGLFVRCFGCSV